mgnify:FL=1
MTTQKTYVDYKNLGDTGTATAASIQPITDGEAAVAATFGRPAENLRSRTEIARDTFGDLLYYRDRTSRYLIELGAGGSLVWEAGGAGTGIVNNTTQLTLRPFITPRTNQKGVLHVGTNAVNRVSYTVAATAYATDGMNEITVEHRSVTGTVTPTVTISSGPVYRILVVFDSAVATHNSATVTGLVNTAIAGVAALTGKISAINNGATGTAIATLAETSIDTRTHAAGTAGNATADVEAHTLAANALSTFTTSNPLTEGDLLAIRYDYVIEPSAGDSNDPKGGVRGGRAESNQSRSNSDVSANLFIAQAHPEWLPGCIPLCKVVNGSLHWVDGTVLATGSSGMPGSSLSSYVNSSAWAGSPTLVVGGGISNSPTTDTPQEALDSVNQRLGQLRSVTWTVSDNTLSTGGHYNGATQVDAAIAATQSASMYGGVVYLRRGNYTNVFANGSMTVNGVTLRGETYDVTLTLGATNTYANTLPVVMENVALQRSAAYVLTLAGDVRMQNVRANPGMLKLGTTSTANVRLDRLVMVAAGVSAATTYGISFEGKTVHATNCDFVGPDTLVSSGGSVVNFGQNVQSAVFDNCTFTAQGQNTLFAFSSFGANTASQGIVFRKCTFSGALTSAYLLDITSAMNAGFVQFEDCVFTNTSSSPLLRVLPGAGSAKVKLVDCTLLTGTSAVTAGSYQQIITLCPAAGSTIDLVRCRTTLGQLNTGAGTVSSLEFGGNNSTNASNVTGAGITTITDCTIELASTVTSLPLFCFLYVNGTGGGAQTAVIDGLLLDFNDKQLTGTPTNGPNGYSAGAVLTTTNAWIHKLVMKRPPVVNTATNVSILNSTGTTHYEASYSEGTALSAPIVARYRFLGGYLVASGCVSLNTATSGAPAFYFSTVTATDCTFAGIASQAAHAGVVVTSGGAGATLKFRGCYFYLYCGNTTTSGLQLIGDRYGFFQGCDIYYFSTGVAEAAIYIATGWQGLLIENNVITTNFNGLGTANVAAKGTATLNNAGIIMTGNVFRNVNAGALSIDVTVSSGTGNQVANNAFLVSVSDP